MSRRAKPEAREVLPDVRYQNQYVQLFIHRMMRRGKKSTATRVMYDSLDMAESKSGKPAIEILDLALKMSAQSWKCVHVGWGVQPIKYLWKSPPRAG